MLLGCMCYWIVCSGELCVLLGICVGVFFIMLCYVCCWVVCWIVCVDGLYVLLGSACCKVVVLCALLGCVHWLVVCVVCLYTLLSICDVGFYMLLSCMYCVIVYGMWAVFCRSVVYVVRLYMGCGRCFVVLWYMLLGYIWDVRSVSYGRSVVYVVRMCAVFYMVVRWYMLLGYICVFGL